jgi:hypothetical protein
MRLQQLGRKGAEAPGHIGTGSDGGMAEGGNCRQEVHSRVAKPGSVSAQAGQSRQNFPLPLELVLPHTRCLHTDERHPNRKLLSIAPPKFTLRSQAIHGA